MSCGERVNLAAMQNDCIAQIAQRGPTSPKWLISPIVNIHMYGQAEHYAPPQVQKASVPVMREKSHVCYKLAVNPVRPPIGPAGRLKSKGGLKRRVLQAPRPHPPSSPSTRPHDLKEWRSHRSLATPQREVCQQCLYRHDGATKVSILRWGLVLMLSAAPQSSNMNLPLKIQRMGCYCSNSLTQQLNLSSVVPDSKNSFFGLLWDYITNQLPFGCHKSREQLLPAALKSPRRRRGRKTGSDSEPSCC